MKTLGIILARGGSKRLPGKNKKYLCGKPLIMYTINAAKKSELTDIVVSSDDKGILNICKEIEGITTIKRPLRLALDDTPSFTALKHAVLRMESESNKYDKVVLLQPTSPFRTATMINNCIHSNTDATITAHRTSVDKLQLNGAVFVLKRHVIDMIRKPKGFLIDDLLSIPIITSIIITEPMIDIDTQEDFNDAKIAMRKIK